MKTLNKKSRLVSNVYEDSARAPTKVPDKIKFLTSHIPDGIMVIKRKIKRCLYFSFLVFPPPQKYPQNSYKDQNHTCISC